MEARGAVGPAIKNIRPPGRFLHRPTRPRRRASAAKKKKARRAWHTPGQFMEETIPILGDQDSEIYARRMPRGGTDLKHAPKPDPAASISGPISKT